MTAASTPKLDRTMKLADGRMLAFSEWGDLDGRPVALLHGMPGSRLMCPDTEATETAGVRLITIDRPGYGRSDPRPDRTLLNWVDDYVELADHLRLDACPVVGWASGGMYALACAYRLGNRVPAVAVAGSPGPTREVPGAMADLSPEGRALVELLQRDRAVGIEAISRSVEAGDGEGLHVPLRFRASPATDRIGRTRFMLSSGDADDRLLARPEPRSAIDEWLQEGARQGSSGLVWDWIARIDDIGFSIADIQQPVHVSIGTSDRQVARYHADYMVATIPRAKLVAYPGEGHLFLFDHWAETLASVVG